MAEPVSEAAQWALDLEALLATLSRAETGFWAGARERVPRERLLQRHPELLREETRDQVSSRLQGASDEERPALQRLHLGLGLLRAEAASATARSDAEAKLAAAEVTVELEQMSLPDALVEALRTRDLLRRKQLGKGARRGEDAAEVSGLESVEQRLAALSKLGMDATARAALRGQDRGKLVAEARLLLKDTRDAAYDLLDFQLHAERVPAGVGDVPRYDLEWALELPSLRDAMPVKRPLDAVHGLFEAIGINEVEREVQLDLDRRPGRFPGLRCARFSAHERVVAFPALETPGDLDRVLEGVGWGFHAAHSGQDPLEARLDPSRGWAWAWGVASALELPGWHRKTLRVSARESSAIARGFALRHLLRMRRTAAELLAADVLEQVGPGEQAREALRDQLSGAMGSDFGAAGVWLLSWDDAASRLKAEAGADSLSQHLLEQADEDWWRNPHSAELLQDRARSGVVADAPPLGEAARRLLERALG